MFKTDSKYRPLSFNSRAPGVWRLLWRHHDAVTSLQTVTWCQESPVQLDHDQHSKNWEKEQHQNNDKASHSLSWRSVSVGVWWEDEWNQSGNSEATARPATQLLQFQISGLEVCLASATKKTHRDKSLLLPLLCSPPPPPPPQFPRECLGSPACTQIVLVTGRSLLCAVGAGSSPAPLRVADWMCWTETTTI